MAGLMPRRRAVDRLASAAARRAPVGLGTPGVRQVYRRDSATVPSFDAGAASDTYFTQWADIGGGTSLAAAGETSAWFEFSGTNSHVLADPGGFDPSTTNLLHGPGNYLLSVYGAWRNGVSGDKYQIEASTYETYGYGYQATPLSVYDSTIPEQFYAPFPHVTASWLVVLYNGIIRVRYIGTGSLELYRATVSVKRLS
jgi:hypothetical protein